MKHNKMYLAVGVFYLVFSTLYSISALSEQRSGNRKVQEVNFEGESVDGVIRRPDGLYMVQKRSIDFLPIYQVRKSFDQNIKESVEHLR